MYIEDLQKLVGNWLTDSEDSTKPLEYRQALTKSIEDLNSLISKFIDEELAYNDYQSMRADSVLSDWEYYEHYEQAI